MPEDNYYDDEEESTSSDGQESAQVDEEVDVPEAKLGLVPMSFFKNEVKPGDREKIEVVKVYDNEVAIKCIYGEDKEEPAEEEEDMAMSGPSEAEGDEMMA